MEELIFKYEKGLMAKDIITGFKGRITARIDYITGCRQYQLQPEVDKEGKIPEPNQFDETRIEIIGNGSPLKAKVDIKEKKKEDGGPQKSVNRSH